MSSLELREKTDAPSKLEPQPKAAATDVTLRMSSMRAGVIDVGSNTVRLLVAASDGRGLNTILNERTHVGLAADIERTATISEEKLAQAGEVAAHYAACGRRCGAERLEIVVTAPGRQSSNAEDLRRILADATGLTVRQLSAEEEGRLAYAGAVVTSRSIPEAIGVIDIGGGSTQLLVGTAEGPSWQHCLDLGSLRLTERYVREDPPAPSELAALIDAVKRLFDPITPPIPHSVLATGGTARSLRRITGRRFGDTELNAALDVVAVTPAAQVAAVYALPLERARVLAAGTIVLSEAQRRLGVRLEVARGGLREGAVLGLLDDAAAAAA